MNNDPIFVRMNNELTKQGRMQKDLIEFLGMGKGTYTQWKIAANQSYRSHLPEIAEYLDISLEYLAGSKDNNECVRPKSKLVVTNQDEMDLVRIYRMAQPEMKNALMTLIRSVLV